MNTNIADKNHFFKGQIFHLISFAVLIGLCSILIPWGYMAAQTFWGINGALLCIISIVIAPLHQFYVWFAWRSELCFKRISPLCGGKGFRVYTVGFGILIIARALSIVSVGIADCQTLPLHWIIRWVIVTIMGLSILYTFYSIYKYFGYDRATGADHFFPEYRNKPFVRKGMFRFTSNSMYTFGILIFPLIGLICGSGPAIIIGTYQYAGVWIHYFSTEKPDIKVIYADKHT